MNLSLLGTRAKVVGIAFGALSFLIFSNVDSAVANCATGLTVSGGNRGTCVNIDESWGSGTNFTYTATGYFKPDVSGSYQFRMYMDDAQANDPNRFIKISGQRLPDPTSPNNYNGTTYYWGYSGSYLSLDLVAGRTYTVEAKLSYSGDGASGIRLEYDPPGLDGLQTVPASRFTTVQAVVAPDAPTSLSATAGNESA